MLAIYYDDDDDDDNDEDDDNENKYEAAFRMESVLLCLLAKGSSIFLIFFKRLNYLFQSEIENGLT